MNILAFAASNSSRSINKILIRYTCSLIKDHAIEIVDIHDYEMPIYSSDREKNDGVPQKATLFAQKIDACDLILISFAEHNGAYTTAFKNIFDWLSVIPHRKTWGEKNMLLMATSPGIRGGMGVLDMAVQRFPFNGGNVVGQFSLPSFAKNFDVENNEMEAEKKRELVQLLSEIVTE